MRLSLIGLLSALLLSACQRPQHGSEEYWYNKMRDEQRAQCRLLPAPLSDSCVKDADSKSYQEYLRQRSNNPPAQTDSK